MSEQADRNRADQEALERWIAAEAPPVGCAVSDDDPRRCPEGGVGRLHELVDERDGVRRCKHCRRDERQLAALLIVAAWTAAAALLELFDDVLREGIKLRSA